MSNSLDKLRAAYLAARERAETARAARQPLDDELDRQIVALTRAFQVEHVDVITAEIESDLALKQAEKDLRQAMVAEWRAACEAGNESRQLGDGLSIRVSIKLRYDQSPAIAWAREHAPILVKQSIDAENFERMVKGLEQPLDFVTIENQPTAVIKL